MGGDGVGPELVAQALRVLDAVAARSGFVVDVDDLPHSGAHLRAGGALLDDSLVQQLGRTEALLFGAAGDPELPPGTVERELIIGLASRLDLCVGVREAYLHHARLTPLAGLGRGDVDIAIVRDTSEGEAVGPGGRVHPGRPHEVAVSVIVHTRVGVERALRHAFAVAQNRRRRLAMVSQANTVEAHALWRDVFDEVAPAHPDVESEALYPDHAAMRLVTDPGSFDVIATNMLFGGVLTDLVAGLVDGIGLIGSSRVDPVSGFGMFEPAHGSAPAYTGRNVASPLGTMRALAMLLEAVGEADASRSVARAIDGALSSGAVPGVTARSGISTIEATDAVIAALGAQGAGDQPVPDWAASHHEVVAASLRDQS